LKIKNKNNELKYTVGNDSIRLFAKVKIKDNQKPKQIGHEKSLVRKLFFFRNKNVG